MAKAKVIHVTKKDGSAWCGTKTVKGAKFDAKACNKCKALVSATFDKKE